MGEPARWTQRPEGANWGDFGPDDQLGRVNLIGSEQILKGAADVQFGRRSILPLHHPCRFKLGIPLGELWYLRDLAAWLHENGRNRFMLTAPPLRLPGAVGSPVTPIATV